MDNINFDIGDFNQLKNYFSFEVKKGFNEDIMNINFLKNGTNN